MTSPAPASPLLSPLSSYLPFSSITQKILLHERVSWFSSCSLNCLQCTFRKGYSCKMHHTNLRRTVGVWKGNCNEFLEPKFSTGVFHFQADFRWCIPLIFTNKIQQFCTVTCKCPGAESPIILFFINYSLLFREAFHHHKESNRDVLKYANTAQLLLF